MSASEPACKFSTQSIGFGGQMHQLCPQFPTGNKDFETVSATESILCKKPRICENSVPSPNMLMATNNAIMTGSFKTQLCAKFRLGYCNYGNKCLFAHGVGDLRKRLPNYPRHGGKEDRLARTWNGGIRMIDKANLCRMFYLGKECAYGDKCRFIHVNPENTRKDLGRYRECSAISIATTGSSGIHGSGFASSRTVIKKRKLCNNWMMTGGCPYGAVCCFAHAEAELGKAAGHIALESGMVSTYSSKTLPMGKDGIGTGHKQQVQGKHCVFKWRAVKKLDGIYADWID